MRRAAAILIVMLAVGCGREPAPAAPPVEERATAPAVPPSPAPVAAAPAIDSAAAPPQTPAGGSTQTAIFASGCFWCTESDFDKVTGVTGTVSGYIGGHVLNPTYEQVSSGGTGHVESVAVTFDPAVVSYARLLDVYWRNVDPFNARGQFCDLGEQYRPVIWVRDAAQRAAAEASKVAVEKTLGRRVAVTIEPVETFYAAEDYHQDYYKKNPVRYNYYRWGCGRDARLAELWGAPD